MILCSKVKLFKEIFQFRTHQFWLFALLRHNLEQLTVRAHHTGSAAVKAFPISETMIFKIRSKAINRFKKRNYVFASWLYVVIALIHNVLLLIPICLIEKQKHNFLITLSSVRCPRNNMSPRPGKWCCVLGSLCRCRPRPSSKPKWRRRKAWKNPCCCCSDGWLLRSDPKPVRLDLFKGRFHCEREPSKLIRLRGMSAIALSLLRCSGCFKASTFMRPESVWFNTD